MSGSRVSIPFKRESVSKVSEESVGKDFGKEVSIPFKRESVSKARESPSPKRWR